MAPEELPVLLDELDELDEDELEDELEDEDDLELLVVPPPT